MQNSNPAEEGRVYKSPEWLKAEMRGSMYGIIRGVMLEIGEALTPILGNAQLLLQQERNAENAKMLQSIVDHCLHATELVRRLQEQYTLSARASKRSIDINEAIRQVVEMTEPWWKYELRRQGRAVDVIADLRDLPPVIADPAALHEALLQTLINAVEAIAGQGHIEIKTEYANGQVRIMFIDNGVGIPEHVRQRIFEPFVSTKGAQRAGLGLTTVQAVVADHGGQVEVFSREGAGTTVVITLPSAPPEVKGDNVDIIYSEMTVPAQSVLVIQDEEPVRQLLARVLEKEGHRVTVVSSAQEGLLAFRRGSFSAVFTDWGLEALSGLQLAQRIKELTPGTRVILVTGWGTQLDQRRVCEWCVDAILNKPFTIEQVKQKLREALCSSGG